MPQFTGIRFEDQDRDLEPKSMHQGHLQKAQNDSDLRHRETNMPPRKAQMVQIQRPKTSPNIAHASALKIQRAFRGYLVS
jgi:IQ calmodulin-binding motif